jgi:hypothetical protein
MTVPSLFNLTDEELVRYANTQPELTPLERELTNRLEIILQDEGWGDSPSTDMTFHDGYRIGYHEGVEDGGRPHGDDT